MVGRVGFGGNVLSFTYHDPLEDTERFLKKGSDGKYPEVSPTTIR